MNDNSKRDCSETEQPPGNVRSNSLLKANVPIDKTDLSVPLRSASFSNDGLTKLSNNQFSFSQPRPLEPETTNSRISEDLEVKKDKNINDDDNIFLNNPTSPGADQPVIKEADSDRECKIRRQNHSEFLKKIEEIKKKIEN